MDYKKNPHTNANLKDWYGFVYSTRFWQYFSMNSFATFMKCVFYRDIGRAGLDWRSNVISSASVIVFGLLFARLGFKWPFGIIMGANIIIGVFSIVIELIDPGPNGEKYHHLQLILYRFIEALGAGETVLIVASTPRTFGIKYGSLVMCFVQLGHICSLVLALLIEKKAVILNTAGIITSFIALIISSCLFRETLDIFKLLKKRQVIFTDFGIKIDPNYSPINSFISKSASRSSTLKSSLLFFLNSSSFKT